MNAQFSSFINNIFRKNTLFPRIEFLFQKVTENKYYSLKIKTNYSDIILIDYYYDQDNQPKIKISTLRNPISFITFDHYAQLIQTYYCFTLLMDEKIMKQLYELLKNKINPIVPREITRRQTGFPSILSKFGGVSPKKLDEATEANKKYTDPIQTLLHFFHELINMIQTKKQELSEQFYFNSPTHKPKISCNENCH